MGTLGWGGAGVVGLAIGFRTRTLVKDIVWGIFFLIDDAFRKGEPIDIGAAKGGGETLCDDGDHLLYIFN